MKQGNKSKKLISYDSTYFSCSLSVAIVPLNHYRSGKVNSNMVNSKVHLIRSYCEIFFYNFPNISCLKYTVNFWFEGVCTPTEHQRWLCKGRSTDEFPFNSKQNLADEWLRINLSRPVLAIIDKYGVPIS